MNDLQIFKNSQFGEVRVIQKDGEPWFVAVDVCRALDIQNHKDAVRRLDDDEKSGVVLTDPMADLKKRIVSTSLVFTLWYLGAGSPKQRHSSAGLPTR